MKVKDSCIKCGNKRNISRGDGRLRTLCRLCWNEYCKKKRIESLDDRLVYMREYMREYIQSGKSKYINDKKYLDPNNKSNKKAITELKDSYVKNRLFKSKKQVEVDYELIELQRALLKLKREIKNECIK